MSVNTPTNVEWEEYTVQYFIRAFGASVAVSLIVFIIAAVVPGPAWWVLGLGSIAVTISGVCVLFWTIAEMIEDEWAAGAGNS